MKSWRCTNLLIALACAPALLAADWLPLQTGNQWVYRGSGTRQTEPLVLRVGESREFSGHTYYQLQGLPDGSYWLRNDGDRVLQWKEDTSEDALWYDFSRKVGETYGTSLPGGIGAAVITSKEESIKTVAGKFSNGIAFAYPRVFQVGITKEVFIDGVGLVTRAVNTGGPSTASYELVYARLGSATVLKGPENGIQLSLNEDKTWARLQVDAQPSSGKVLRLYDETGSEVWSWSSEQKWFSVTGDPNVELPAMKPGPYVLTAEAGDNRISLPFTVQQP
ncbi:hypothetical protein [Paludibaculum fermentans]|uniref:hypothetical protein n=1 Tax=Paludibaculum fermentans TaxID=1473598 RepID=UPI003EBBD4FA